MAVPKNLYSKLPHFRIRQNWSLVLFVEIKILKLLIRTYYYMYDIAGHNHCQKGQISLVFFFWLTIFFLINKIPYSKNINKHDWELKKSAMTIWPYQIGNLKSHFFSRDQTLQYILYICVKTAFRYLSMSLCIVQTHSREISLWI